MQKKTRNVLFVGLLVVLALPFAWPERARIPVQGAAVRDWNEESFWYEPWGASGVHKGIDIFAAEGRPVISPVDGIVLFKGHLRLGGNVVAVLGPRWRIHYCAHLQTSSAKPFQFVRKGTKLGTVGTSGNAAGKAPHLHYSVLSLAPRVWGITRGTQGWKRMFFVDPDEVLRT